MWFPPPLPPPPPHARRRAASVPASTTEYTSLSRRFLVRMTKRRRSAEMRVAAPPVINHLGLRIGIVVEGAVVVMVNVELPLVATVVGLIAQVALGMVKKLGHWNEIVPVKLYRAAAVMTVEPDWPGAEMLMLVGFAA